MNVTGWIPDMAWDATISLGAATTTCVATIQLKDFAGNALTTKNAINIFVTTDAAGDETEAVTSVVLATHGIIHTIQDTYAYQLITEDNGIAAVTIDGTGDVDNYLNVVLPNGKIVTSAKIDFTG